MIQFYCAHLDIYIRNKEEEEKRLLRLYNFLDTLKQEKKFLSHTLQSTGWLDKVKWKEACRMPKDDSYAKSKKADISIDIGNETEGISLEIEKFDNYKFTINIHRRAMMFDDNTCLEWHHRLITLLVEEGIVDVGYIFPGLPKDNPKWYSSKNEPSFWIGKRNFLILEEFHGVGIFYEKRKKILTNFIQKNWDELNQKDNILILLKKEKKDLLKEARSSFFSKLFDYKD